MGTGGTTFKPVTGASMSKLKWQKLSLEFMVNADIRAVDKTLRRKFKLQLAKQKYPEKSNYLRIQTKSELKMNAVDKENIKNLLLAGEKMWNDQKADGMKMIREICDEKFGETIVDDGPLECSAERPDCFTNGIDCIKRYVVSISNPNSSGYKNALKKDPTLVRGNELYTCYPEAETPALLEKHNVKDSRTSVTLQYIKMNP